ncbi:MAG: hypothetical protein IJU68_05365 [Bacteroidales bacterium]|nr:hypothetical protein [Bacteroidales bacterium]
MVKVACIGDSITWGFTILRRGKLSYPAQLNELLGPDFLVKNFGVNNSCASFHSDLPYGLTRCLSAALRFNPDMVVMMLGTNDSKRINWNPLFFREGYNRILDRVLAMEQFLKVCLMVPPPVFSEFGPEPFALSNRRLECEVIPAIVEIADYRSLPLIDLHTALADRALFNDGVHPSSTGAAVIANEVYKVLNLL